MAIVVTPAETRIMTALRGFLISILPQGTTQFSGSISGVTLTALAPSGGTIALGMAVMGVNILPGTYIIGLGTGTGGAGTYTLNQPQTVAQTFLWSGVPVVRGQTNRVPEPKQGDLVIMWPILKRRLSTNIRSSDDVAFTGSIAGATLTVSAVDVGGIAANQIVQGAGVTAGTRILTPISASGGVGTYLVTPSQTTASTLMTSGQENVMEPTEYTVQIDVHGPNASDNAQMISQLFRDAYGATVIGSIDANVQPLHADDPRQIPFINGESQYETRWVINAVLQTNITVNLPTQFAAQAEIATINVEAAFPA